jgi:hypothetical protein
VRLAKAHGLGNDFLLVAAAEVPEAPASWARRLCDRTWGGGRRVLPTRDSGIAMRLINADGSDAEISGTVVPRGFAVGGSREPDVLYGRPRHVVEKRAASPHRHH